MATSLAATAAGTALEDLPEDTLLAILARRRRRLLRLPSPRRRRVLPGSPARPRAPLRPPSPAPSPPLSHRCAPPPPLPPPPPSPPRPLAPPLLLPPRRLPWTPLPRRVRVGPACHARRLPPLFAPSPRLPIHPEWRPMAGEGEDEAAAIELQLEQHLQEQRSSLAAVDEALAAVDEALAADPSNADLLEVHEELLAAIKDAEEGLLHLKRSRLVKQIDEIFPNQESTSQVPEVAVEPLQPDDVEPEPLEQQEFSVGSKCRFRHKDGRWYNGCIIGLEGSRDARISFLTPTSENMSMLTSETMVI